MNETSAGARTNGTSGDGGKPQSTTRQVFTLRRDPLPRMSRPPWLARLPHVLTVVAAVSFTAITNNQLSHNYHSANGFVYWLAVLMGVAILLAMFRPMAGWWLATATATAMAVEIHDTVGQGQLWPWIPSAMFAYAVVVLLVALRVPARVTTAAVSTALGLALLGELLWSPELSSSSVGGAGVLFAFTGVLGYALQAVRLARGRLEEQETLTEAERAQRALLEERSRIARELHDVVAHHMSVISIQAQVAPHLVEKPSEELKENLAGIRENAVEALTELRRVLGVLRSEQPGDEANPHHPQPTLADLDGLVENVRGAGLEVTTELAGVRRPLTPGVELTAYRIVQEALSNCLRHAPGSRVEVGIAYGPHELHLCVANTAPTRQAPPSPGAGHGLLGMRERAGMLGGELAAGPRPGGGYEVTAVLPMDSPAGAPEPAGPADRAATRAVPATAPPATAAVPAARKKKD
ncbi:sensor histidine kinase [Streptomyces sp. NPDC089799]|uniref:sensor histidine kinase n=1 Tax=Streptomyces sp. NPDC089799 TaxID=3155066 RepID=UPI00341D87D4